MRMTPRILKTIVSFAVGVLLACAAIAYARLPLHQQPSAHFQPHVQPALGTYLGFDRNDYSGDAVLDALAQDFVFCGYWLNPPPGEKSDTWLGKRAILRSYGFGFLVLFNGRLDKELKSARDPKTLGSSDATAAVHAARKEGFPPGTILFLDQEEGGRMLPEQQAYLYAWIDAVNSSDYKAGIYCSGIPVQESLGVQITTANDIQNNARGRKISFFIYNDVCPPAPGCDLDAVPLLPGQSGVPSATAWQFAQSPRRPELTALCPYPYNSDGNCYAPLPGNEKVHVDLDSAASRDPSNGR
jgi:hypothetical protein